MRWLLGNLSVHSLCSVCRYGGMPSQMKALFDEFLHGLFTRHPVSNQARLCAGMAACRPR